MERYNVSNNLIYFIFVLQGILGFYKGLTASYYGISETVIHFVIYEAIKAKLAAQRERNSESRSTRDFLEFMLAGATSKTFASSVCYPHGKLIFLLE